MLGVLQKKICDLDHNNFPSEKNRKLKSKVRRSGDFSIESNTQYVLYGSALTLSFSHFSTIGPFLIDLKSGHFFLPHLFIWYYLASRAEGKKAIYLCGTDRVLALFVRSGAQSLVDQE